MTKNTQQSLPGATLFFAQRPAQIGQHQQLVLGASLTKGAATHIPTADAAGENHLHDVRTVRRAAIEACRQTKLGTGALKQTCRRLRQ